METKYIFVTGGVSSSLGKGIIAASLGKLLQSRGFRVTIQKLDPYINVDPGTLNPYEHGECYVTVDGHEADLDLGHYERFLNVETHKTNNITTGRIYQSVIEKERRGDYLGKTVQIIPHITDEIKHHITSLGQTGQFDFVITEIGGTVGDIESLPFIESMRQLRWEMGRNCCCIHLTYVPYLAAAKELKTKPTQHSVKDLQQEGVQPDIIVLRTEHEIPTEMRRKVALFCNVDEDAVIQSIDASTIYRVPLNMLEEDLDRVVLRKTGFDTASLPEADLASWNAFLEKLEGAQEEVKIALVGKYVQLQDAYKSIREALSHAAAYNNRKLSLTSILSDDINAENVHQLADFQVIVIAPGFGNRGATEFDEHTSHNIIDLMEAQKRTINKGGSMRLGAYPCQLKEGSRAREIYGCESIRERHRHRYELNHNYLPELEQHGLICSGINPESGLTEIIELQDHPWFIGTQFHPEYSSTVLHPHPLFMSFMQTLVAKMEKN